jgi:hypothetical protein
MTTVPMLASALETPMIESFVADMPIAKRATLGALDEAELAAIIALANRER